MVSVRRKSIPNSSDELAVCRWLQRICGYLTEKELAELLRTITHLRLVNNFHSGESRKNASIDEISSTGMQIVEILAELGGARDALISGFLYPAVRAQIFSVPEIAEVFGEDIRGLISGTLRMTLVSEYGRGGDIPILGQAESPKDNIRHMLVAMIDDVRIALIKLAERTVAMRKLKNSSRVVREAISQEVFDVYAPLADRLGVGHLKWELEDLSFRYAQPDSYHRVAKLLDGKRTERDRYILRVKHSLDEMLRAGGLRYEVTGRAKHIFSIWRKMQRKGIGFEEVHDALAVRILVDTVQSCYHTLGIVHGIWRSIPKEFDDYIANPKENGYRSLHTSVIGPEGKVLEVQIRTRDMHAEAELGVCAHWDYKNEVQNSGPSSGYDQKLTWLRQVLEWYETHPQEVDETLFTFESAQDRVFVFTPKGDVVSLADGATPIDFAYHVHTEVGHRCRGAKVNGSIVPLYYRLQTGERVEILTAKGARPRRDWLQMGARYVRTPRARAAVHHWFRVQTREENIAAGRSLVERECARLGLTSLDYRSVARKTGLANVEDMYAAAGSGELNASQILSTAEEIVGKPPEIEIQLTRNGAVGSKKENSHMVGGVGNLKVHLAKCCLPTRGDDIEGFLTRSRGVTVHRTDCARLLSFQGSYPERIIAVSWVDRDIKRFEVNIEIHAVDRQGLLADISTVMSKHGVNVTAMNTQSDRSDHTAEMRIRAEVLSIKSLSEVLSAILQLDNVVSATRIIQ